MGENPHASAMTSSAHGTGLPGALEYSADATKTDHGSFTAGRAGGTLGGRGSDDDGDDDGQESTTDSYDFWDDSGSKTNEEEDTTATTTRASEADVSTEPEWLRDNSPIVMCAMGSKKLILALLIPDGLCNIVVYSGGLQSDNTFYNTHSQRGYFNLFRRVTGAFKRTLLGLDVVWSDHSSTTNKLSTTDGRAAMLQYFKEGFRNFGTLDTEIESNTGDSYLTDIISLLQGLRSVQMEAPNRTNMPCFLFYGVALLYQGAKDFDAKMVAAFNKVLTNTQPDIVLFRTTYLTNNHYSHKCRVTGTSVWDEAVVGDQPTFVGALKFRENITLPSRTREMLSFTVCGRLSHHRNQTLSGMGAQCKMGINIDSYPRVCPGAHYTKDYGEEFLDTGRLVAYRKSNDGHTWHVYDNRQTIMAKACMSKMNFGFRGGWVVFNVECSDLGKLCGHPLSKDVFAFVHTVKHAMRTSFNSCSVAAN
ncbi:uncharacterized protein LOC135388256 isoform X2 [Ornithodoros turicata]|uniref:uncharacterized protein LOC135388256 isoform X2 n=1 Tax=Ornithodoros turicata TaxID=34597 RepID=UPI003138BCD1